MDEMQLLRDLGNETPAPAAADLTGARAKLLAGIAEDQPAPPAARPPATRPLRRLAWTGGVAVGLAAAAAVIAVVALSPAAPIAPAPPPRHVLLVAAEVVRAQPELRPREDQFVYSKQQRPDGWYYEQWASVDGTHDGRYSMNGQEGTSPGCRGGKRAIPADEGGGAKNCIPFRVYYPDLPTKPDAVLAYLREDTRGEGTGAHSVNVEAMNLIESVLAPAARAALYETLAKIPELTVRTGTQDPSGRPAVTVSWTVGDLPLEFYLDPKTYEFLGREGSGSLVAHGIVDKVGQKP
ncbi:CU044_5270 family protein [Amycolatopsis sp. lyj-112]|uniref:CU044_5270 family protein n=1 Tax=Amycolatopsis sp. lyj-112 TaxID=2789288 RepID=UPI00397A74C9